MKVVVAPDSFKGSLSAVEAARAISRGVLATCPGAVIEVCPLSDGGEGFLDVLLSASGGAVHTGSVVGPNGGRVTARWGLLADGATAVLESAEAVGLSRASLPSEPTRTSTYGVGELVRLALDHGVATILVGLGGTATTDGGAGMAQALGAVFRGAPTPLTARDLALVRSIEPSLDPRLGGVVVIAATDVDSPLTGPGGAARTFSPQKGATPDDVESLEAALAHLARLTGDAGEHPGDGAAGGLGYGLRVFAGASRASGIDLVLDRVGFERRCAGAALAITGEGRLDAQSARGKVVSGVARRARALGVPVVALAGALGDGVERFAADACLAAYRSFRDDARDATDSVTRAGPLLEALAARVVGEVLSRK